MPDIENKEESREDRKSESLPDISAGPKEVNENISREESIEETELPNQTSEISKLEIMEVHHHPHVAKKNFKEYFFEFIMIFLAVSLGFFAENIREQQTEKKKAEQYILSFYNDLRTDTAEFSLLITRFSDAISALDKRSACYNTLKKNPKSDACLLNLFNYSYEFGDLVNADETILQLKNSGGLSILDKDDADSILKYDKYIRIYIKNETTELQEDQNEIRKVINSLLNYDASLNYDAVQHIYKDTSVPVLYSENKELLNSYFNLLDGYYFISKSNLILLGELKQNAVRLLEYFRNKYHIK